MTWLPDGVAHGGPPPRQLVASGNCCMAVRYIWCSNPLRSSATTTMQVYYQLFRCRRCNWWAIGTHFSEPRIAEGKLPETHFDVKCTAKDCGWAARLLGREAHRRLRSAAAASSAT
jgi:hypothetical protein